MRRIHFWTGALLAAGCGVYVLVFWPIRDPHPRERLAHGTLAVLNAKIYLSPDVPAIET